MHPFKRSARVGDMVRQEVADILQNKIKHKTLGFVTVTGAKITDDLLSATVYVSVLNSEDSKRTVDKLNSLGPFIKGELGKRLKMRYVPSLRFMIDESIEYGIKMDKLFEKIDSGTTNNDEEDDEDLF